MLLNNQSRLSEKHGDDDDVLLNFQMKRKLKREISTFMQVDVIADIISDKLIKEIQYSLNKDKK